MVLVNPIHARANIISIIIISPGFKKEGAFDVPMAYSYRNFTYDNV